MTGRNGNWYVGWCWETVGEVEGAGSVLSPLWLLVSCEEEEEEEEEWFCGLEVVLVLGSEVLAVAASSSDVFLLGLLV